MVTGFGQGLGRYRKPFEIASHVLVVGFVGFVAFFHISNADAAPDERVYRHCAELYLHGMFNCNLQHPVLVKEILAVGIGIGGDSVTTVRIVTGMIALATALFLYLFVTDCTDRRGGLIAAGLWGLLPQGGIEGASTLEAIRIDRFALLDPYVACFFALALWTGWRWVTRGSVLFAGLTGAACMAAACSKSPGVLIVPVICVVPLIARRRDGRRLGWQAVSAFGGACAVFVGSYGPLGLTLARHAITKMFGFQLGHTSQANLLYVAGHLYLHAPWWADFAFAVAGLGVVTAIVLVSACLIGLGFCLAPAGYAVAASLSVVLFTGLYLHLSLPHYWIDWEPGLIAAAALGIRTAFRSWHTGVVAAGCSAALAIAMVTTVTSVADLPRGPYQQAAAKITCRVPCVIAYGAPIGILGTYISHVNLDRAPVRVHDGTIEVRAVAKNRLVWSTPKWIFVDETYLRQTPEPDAMLVPILKRAGDLGYVRVATKGPIELYRRRSGLPIVTTPVGAA